MSEYEGVRRGKLILKGHETKGKKRKHKKSSHKDEDKETFRLDAEAMAHGGWWRVGILEDVKGSIAIQWGGAYIAALDNGLLSLGPPRGTDGPAPEEILTAVPAGTQSVAFKSGYGKYLSIEQNGRVTARADAVGPLEHWEPIWENGKTAILSALGTFLTIDDDDSVIAKNKKASDGEHCTIRSSASKVVDTKSSVPKEERGDLKEIEENYVRKFQKFQDKKVKINDDSREHLKKARVEGNLHETLLDRRSKMKADRYCK